jgi:GcrA cell cycle regulator
MEMTNEIADKIKKMWELGSGPGQIVRYFGGRLTKGQVIGKLFRMGLSRPRVRAGDEMVVRIKTRRKPPAELRTRVLTQFGMELQGSAKPLVPSNAARRSFNCISGPAYSVAELDRACCHFPLGDPLSENFCFCAAPAYDNGPYCFQHWRVAYHAVR